MTTTDDIRDMITASGLFDPTFYLAQYPDVAATGIDPLQHFVLHGAAENRDPNETFSIRAYRAATPGLLRGENPLVHFIRSAKTDHLPTRPTGLSDAVYAKLRQSKMFDAAWYLRRYPDVRDAGIDPLMHFLNFGWAENRRPASKFPLEDYRARYRTELADGTNPLVDYVLNADRRSLQFSYDERILLRRQWYADIALDISVAVEDRFRAACCLVTNVQDQYDDLIALFGTLAQEPNLSQAALRMQVLCRQLARRAKRLPMTPYRDPMADKLPGPVADPILAHESVMVLRRPNAARVILVFTGADSRVWVPVQVFQSYLPEDAHVVFLRDPLEASHLCGLGALGFGYYNTLNGFRFLIESLGASQIYCIGSSSGGGAAMRYGMDLGATRCLVFVPTTNLEMPILATQDDEPQIDWRSFMPAGSQDLRQVYLQNPNHPPTTIVFGDANVYDRQQAQHMQDLPKVTLVKVADYAGHDVISELISAGHLEGLIQELLAPV